MDDQNKTILSSNLKLQYAGLFLLYEIEYSEECPPFYAQLNDDQKVLSPVFKWLFEKAYIELDPGHRYKITAKGQDVVKAFAERYLEFLREFDVYCAVDLEAGDFAFQYYNDYGNADEWHRFLQDDRWEDLRVAVAEFKGWDILEIIFMSFLSEGAFGRDSEGNFDYNSLLGTIWDEIESIADSAIRMDSLAYEDNGEIISAAAVLNDMISQGDACLSRLNI